MKHDSEHIRIMAPLGEVEREILHSIIWIDEFMLSSDDRLLESLDSSIFLLRGLLYELSGFLDNEYDQILETFSVLEARIANDTAAALIAADAMLVPLFDDFSTATGNLVRFSS